jgi:hypothetical protein
MKKVVVVQQPNHTQVEKFNKVDHFDKLQQPHVIKYDTRGRG